MADRDEEPRVRPDLLRLPGYEPVQPPAEMARRLGMSPEELLKLDGNENPFGPSPKVTAALASFDGYAVYPDPLQMELRRAIGAYVGAPAERIVVGSGSDELIDLCFRALVDSGQRIVNCPPTFGMYRFAAEVARLPLDEVERREDFSLDLEAVRAAVRAETALIVVAVPNNPTGNGLSEAELASLLETGVTVLVDEAYAEFAGHSFVSWTADHPRLIVLRTFSKWAGLAGLRVGYGVFPPNVVETLLRIKQPYNVNRAAEAAVLASLADRATLEERVRLLVQARDRLFAALGALTWLRPYPSEGNFLLCEVEGAEGSAFKEALAKRGVFGRYFATPRLRQCVRLSVPRPDQIPALLDRVRQAGADLGLR